MAYVGRDFDVANPSESDVFALDFLNDLAPNDGILTATVSLSVNQGTDPTPAARLILVPAVTGTRVMQRVANLVPGCRYCFTVTVNTQQGSTLTLFSHITCRAPV